MALAGLLAACASTPRAPSTAGKGDALIETLDCAVRPDHRTRSRCIGAAIAALRTPDDRVRVESVNDGRIDVEVMTRSADLGDGVELVDAWSLLSAEERAAAGDAIPVLLVGRDHGETLPEGVYRPAVMSIERGLDGRLTVRIDEPALDAPPAGYVPMLGFHSWRDASSPLWRGLKATLSPLQGFERPHVHLMEERRGPGVKDVILVHGLASNPEIWAPMLEALYERRDLACCVRVWIVYYPSAPPVLVNRLRIAAALDDARRRHAIDEPWSGVVIGHSMGGVIGRLLTVDPGVALTDVAFGGPMVELQATPKQREAIATLLQFPPLMRCGRLVTLAAPFDGAPGASGWFARLLAAVQPKQVPELRPLRTVARANPMRVPEELRETYVSGLLTSLTTLRSGQPVLARAAALRQAPCQSHLSIAGTGRTTAGVDGDGVVPTASALHPQSARTLKVEAGHDVYRHPEAIEAMLDQISKAVQRGP